MKKAKKILSVLISGLAVFALLPMHGEDKPVKARAATTYTVRDDFGRIPSMRDESEHLERVGLSDEHKPYTKYGYGMHLDAESTGREYLSYELTGVKTVEVSAIIRQSNFGAKHGWGVSLGVTDDPLNNPLNNVNNINLNSIYPIYLSEDGIPFIYFKDQNSWWCYTEGMGKYSFAPPTENVAENLRAYTVPDEVQGVIDQNGFTILKEGWRYPMINLEYKTSAQGEWEALPLKSTNYRITKAEYIGGEKEYAITVQMDGIPEEAVSVRIGADYIRKTLKPATATDSAPDVYVDFPIPHDEGIYLTGVKFSLGSPYTVEYEPDELTGISVSDGKLYFGYGEEFSHADRTFYEKYASGIEEETDKSFCTVSTNGFDPFQPSTYKITVQKGTDSADYYVEVMRATELKIEYSGNTTVSKKSPFDENKLKVIARTNTGTVKNPCWVEVELPKDRYEVDASAIRYGKGGKYAVAVKTGTGMDTVSGTLTVKVGAKGGCSSNVLSLSWGLPIGLLFIRRKKNAR